MNKIAIYTAGYESREINEFIARLKKHGISMVIDVREVPASRKPGFSKTALSEHLQSAKIKYLHVKELGSPKTLREKLKEDKNYDHFFTEYGKYLKTKVDIVRNLYRDVISHELSCIMCFEREPSQCHRKVVADKIKEIDGNGLVVNHI